MLRTKFLWPTSLNSLVLAPPPPISVDRSIWTEVLLLVAEVSKGDAGRGLPLLHAQLLPRSSRSKHALPGLAAHVDACLLKDVVLFSPLLAGPLTMAAAAGRITAGVGANLIGQHAQDRNQDATVYVGNLDPQVQLLAASPAARHLAVLQASRCGRHLVQGAVLPLVLARAQATEELVWELFTQAGPVGAERARRRIACPWRWASLCAEGKISQRSACVPSGNTDSCAYVRSERVHAQGPRDRQPPGLRLCGVPGRGGRRLCACTSARGAAAAAAGREVAVSTSSFLVLAQHFWHAGESARERCAAAAGADAGT